VSVIEVAISPGEAAGRFRVEVVSSPAGEASAVAGLDVGLLMTRRPELQQAVLTSAVATRKILSESERCVREVGHQLFAALLGIGEVAGRYRASAALAAERGEPLRVVLRIGDPALAGLPWEAMYDEAAGEYVCRRDQVVRHVGVASSPARLAVDPLPLRILAVVSSPRGLPALDTVRERELLEKALARLTAAGLAEVTWAPSAAWEDLQDILLGGVWHAVHFIGHGDFDPGRDEGILGLTREDGRLDLVEASRLVDLLRQARPMPRLVLLNSCAGAAMGATDLFSGTASALVRGGVSAVAAMQYEISDPAAIAFSRGFYGALARGRAVDDAVSSGRVAIVGLNGRTLEWVTPVLYLRGRESRLFTTPAPSSLSPSALHQSDSSSLGPTAQEDFQESCR
jgi:CHAT domain